jgi:outer membrane receptor for ferrienterochelin and colicin
MGGVFNILTKSGSNEFAGSSWVSLTPKSLSPNPKATPWFRELPASDIYEVGAWVGGAFIKDKLFYSIGVDYNLDKSPSYNNLSDLPVGETKTPSFQFMGKFQYFINTDNQVTLSYFGNNQTATLAHGNAPSNLYDGRGTADTSGDTVNNSHNFNLIWDSVLSSNLNLSIKAGQAKLLNEVTPNDTQSLVRDRTYYDVGGPGEGLADPRTYWAAGGGGNKSKETNTTTQFTGDLTWVLDVHSLKFGYSYLKSNYADKTDRNGGQTWMIQNSSGALRAIQNLYQNDSQANAYFQAIYAQDTWQVNKSLPAYRPFSAKTRSL